jgi:hypothetical protein
LQDRKKIEDKAKAAFGSLEGDFKGTYYSLETMTPADERQLIEDHFLFKNDDRYLKLITLDWYSVTRDKNVGRNTCTLVG